MRESSRSAAVWVGGFCRGPGSWVWCVGGLVVDSLAVTASQEGNGSCLIGTFLY